MDFKLKEEYAYLDKVVQKNIIDKFKLQPNFDIQELLKSWNIDTIYIPYGDNMAKANYFWDYSFSFVNDNIKIYYRDLKSELLRERLLERISHNPELLFNRFHFIFDETTTTINLEPIDGSRAEDLFEISPKTKEDIRRHERIILARSLGELLHFCFDKDYKIDYQNLRKITYNNQNFYRGNHEYYEFQENTCLVFAVALLMPYEDFMENFYNLIENNNDITAIIKQLSDHFGVSYKWAQDRCKVLSLIK